MSPLVFNLSPCPAQLFTATCSLFIQNHTVCVLNYWIRILILVLQRQFNGFQLVAILQRFFISVWCRECRISLQYCYLYCFLCFSITFLPHSSKNTIQQV